MSPPWSEFHQHVEDTLARLIAHYDATLRVNGSNVLLCEYLAPRVAAAINGGAEEALAYTGLSAPERVDPVEQMHEHALDVLGAQ